MKKLLLKKDNSGAAMLTVVIAILFIVALGVALLTASYMGFAVTLAQKNGQRNFYDANTAMDDVRAYVHSQASDALANAYTETLRDYQTKKKAAAAVNSTYDAQADFSQKFVAELQKSGTGLLTGSNSTYYFNTSSAALQKAIHKGDSDTVTLTGGSAPVVFNYSGTNAAPTYTSVALKGLSLTYKDAKNYQTTISTDIAINVPTFNLTSSVPHSLKEFSIVANNKLAASGGASVAGNVYAGSVSVPQNGDSITFENGDLLCGGSVSIENGGKLTFSGDTTTNSTKVVHDLWAGGISLSGSSSALETSAYTRTYVKNDLSVLGSSDSVTLRGEYTGFGGSVSDKDSSSAILIGGKNAKFDIGSLTKLTLAGVSFINPTTAINSTVPIPMGQSVAVKTDQLAYLVPVSCLSTAYPTNPYYYTGTTAPTPKVYTDTPLWPNSTDETLKTKTITDYLGQPKTNSSLSFARGTIDTRTASASGSTDHISYVFFNFTDQAAANAYFSDYCKANPQNISQYLGYYLSNSSLVLPGSVNTAGTTYSTGKDATPAPNAASDVSAAGPADLYATAKSVSPYSSFVSNTQNITGPFEFYSGNDLVAVVTNADYTYNPKTDSTLRVIVSTKDVTIPATSTGDAAFSGVIIAGGTVTVKGTVKQPATVDWQTWLAAKTNSGVSHTLSDFLGSGGTSGGSSANNWDLSDLVVYENWKKS